MNLKNPEIAVVAVINDFFLVREVYLKALFFFRVHSWTSVSIGKGSEIISFGLDEFTLESSEGFEPFICSSNKQTKTAKDDPNITKFYRHHASDFIWALMD